MDLSHLRDELANPQMAQTPGHRAHHSALSAQFRQAAQQLTGFWKSSLRSSENAYHRGYLSALADVQATLSRMSNDNIDHAQASSATSTQISALEQHMRLRNYITARMEAVSEDVKATESSEPSEPATSSSQASSSNRPEPARPQPQVLTSFKVTGDADTPNSRASVPAFASSSSAFAPTLSGSSLASKLERTPTFGSGSALGSTPTSAFASQDGPNTAARMARLQYGLPHLRSRGLVNEAAPSATSRQVSSSPTSVRPSQRENGRDMDTASSHVPSSPLSRHQQTTTTGPTSRPTNSLVERVAQARAARASQLSRSESPMPSSSSAAQEASANADSVEAELDTHHSAPPITPSSSPRPLHQSHSVLNTLDSSRPLTQVSSSPFTFAASAAPGSPFLVSDSLSVQPHSALLTSPTFRPGTFVRSGNKTPSKLAASASSKLSSLAAAAAARNTPRAPPKMDYGSTDDEDQRSDGADSDGETGGGTVLRMPMIRRRPPSSYGSDSERKSSGGLGGASLARPRKRRK
ncbi:hypothetical protein OC845_006087 [Tilletia horrida]|nr:hypothetical protein OC845_006087 [Tilletia horrida]